VQTSEALIGQSHPRVTAAVARQLDAPSGAEPSLELARRLAAKMPGGLAACYFLNSLSEANELALRLARAHVPGKDVIVLEDADHGMTTSLKNMSPARGPVKFWAHVARRGDAAHVAETARLIESSGRGLCGFFAEGVFPQGFLPQAYHAVRASGGLCVAIEAQTGLGRVGAAFWEFARQGVVPDVVVVGESLANGLPLAAVVTRPELAVFPPEHGNAVMCAAGLAVLDVLEEDRLADRADRVGAALAEIATRGAGLCWEIDVPGGKRLLLRPPLTISDEDVRALLRELTPAR
jgi:4-aminobutyrate aminotransferase-like enzyme